MTALIIVIVVIVFGAIGFHAGSGHAHYRHQKAGCSAARRRPNLWASLGRGPFVWLSVPGPLGTRIGHKL